MDLQVIQKEQKRLHPVVCCTLILGTSVQLFIYLPLLGFCIIFFLYHPPLVSTFSRMHFETEDKDSFHIAKIHLASWNFRDLFPLAVEVTMWLYYSDWSLHWENGLVIFRCKVFLLTSDTAGIQHWQKSAPNWIADPERALKC